LAAAWRALTNKRISWFSLGKLIVAKGWKLDIVYRTQIEAPKSSVWPDRLVGKLS
jgi:hypothetical protein